MWTYRSVSFTEASDLTQEVVRAKVEAGERVVSKGGSPGFVDETDDLDDFLVLWLRQELCDDLEIVERALSVEDALLSGKPVDSLANATGVVEIWIYAVNSVTASWRCNKLTILRPRNCVKVNKNANTVLPCPLDNLQEIIPRRPLQERLVGSRFEDPVSYGKANPVKASTYIKRDQTDTLEAKGSTSIPAISAISCSV